MAQKTRRPAAPAAPPRRFPWLPLLLAVGALALIIAGAMSLARQPSVAAPAQGIGPKLAVNQEKIDFGEVKIEQPVEATFVLQNVGTEPLQIIGQPQVRVVEGC